MLRLSLRGGLSVIMVFPCFERGDLFLIWVLNEIRYGEVNSLYVVNMNLTVFTSCYYELELCFAKIERNKRSRVWPVTKSVCHVTRRVSLWHGVLIFILSMYFYIELVFFLFWRLGFQVRCLSRIEFCFVKDCSWYVLVCMEDWLRSRDSFLLPYLFFRLTDKNCSKLYAH